MAKNTQENTANSLKTDNLTFMFVLVCIIYIFAALTFFQCLLYQALQNIYLYGIKESQCLKNKINSLQKKF
ncbi:potassium-transporting ATPase subunit KdpA [Campylobacter jejuni]